MAKREYLEAAVAKGYQGREDGSIWLPGRMVWTLGTPTKRNYNKFSLSFEGRTIPINVHRFQAYLKFGDDLFEKGLVVRHIDGNSTNNSWDNLELGTHQENMMDIPAQDRFDHALVAASKNRRFSDLQITEIRNYYAEVKSYAKTMAHFGISSKGSLSHILKNNYVTSK